MTSLLGNVTCEPTRQPHHSPDFRLRLVFLLALAALLVGYMFMGRGFAHLGLPPLYVGEIVLLIGIVITTVALVRSRVLPRLPVVAWLLLGFMVMGLARTLPYLGVYGMDALRDAVLWGYGALALMIYLLADRRVVGRALGWYGWIVPVFALWLPIAYNIFVSVGADIQPDERGSNVPLVFFKSGDMAVHIVGAVAFLVLAAGALTSLRTLAWRAAIAVPLLWTAFVAGSTNRAALLTVAAGIVVVAGLAILLQRSRNGVPILVAPAVLALMLGTAAGFSAWSSSAAATAPPASPSTAPAPDEVPEASPSCEAPPRSLVANPGFEIGTLNDSTIEGWHTAAGLYNIAGDGGSHGPNYAVIQNTGEAWTAAITSTTFPFQAGHDISVSLHARAVEGSPVLATYVHWFDSSGALISSPILSSLPTEGRTSWKEGTGVLTAPEGTADAQVQLFESAGHATVAADAVIVKSGDFVVGPEGTGDARPVGIEQIFENIQSIFSSTDDDGLEGSKEFRLQWWGSIVNYTVFGDYFWTGKGFGVNLADADGFQANVDGSLRAPHNSHLTALARMGVPGFLLWAVLQGAFVIGLSRSILTNRRVGETGLAATGAVLLSYWVAMMVNSSFDPYLEGPQGGIWFWSVFGLGMVVMWLSPSTKTPNG